ncbi:hypothetical protein FEF26_13210 [Nesterenkonia salmonea]|uniref:Uncharacterized protein n=1 Tax=Nesterenkonia salmonea TaxID=1804987 RepID=A0A5R9B960_9MICC|nr:hypothetical protein [Nesterenkonia salmonea]TLP93592.1 hypothetical protein FEF26_13210 [Nesterenkonia salmonea]
MVDEHRQRLTRNMDILTHGLEQIAQDYARHITLAEEDPETFGAGHYVLYPHGRTDLRFAIEERYIDTDWSDPDRLPASWSWKAQTRHQRSDGSHPWVTTDHGVVPSNAVHQLLGYAQKWAATVRATKLREGFFTHMRPGTRRDKPPHLEGPGLS